MAKLRGRKGDHRKILVNDMKERFAERGLSEVETQVLTLALGLDDGVERSLAEIAVACAITEEVARETMSRALRRAALRKT